MQQQTKFVLRGYDPKKCEWRYVITTCETTAEIEDAHRFDTAAEAAEFAVDERVVGFAPMPHGFTLRPVKERIAEIVTDEFNSHIDSLNLTDVAFGNLHSEEMTNANIDRLGEAFCAYRKGGEFALRLHEHGIEMTDPDDLLLVVKAAISKPSSIPYVLYNQLKKIVDLADMGKF